MNLFCNDYSDLISVIVPVYKVERYLNKCVESIVEQTYKNLEIILIDDGSPDHCPQMCDEWAKRDERIRVIHKKNGGLSDARNAGIAEANGIYVGFVDSDDWIAPTMYELLLARMKETESDVASCGAVRVWEDGEQVQAMIKSRGKCVLDREDALKALIQSTCLIQTVWNKLYRTKIVKAIPFEVGKIHEDEYWSWRVIAKANRISTIEDNLYYYLQREDSIMRGKRIVGDPLLVIDAKTQRHAYIIENLPRLANIVTEDLIYTCYYHGCQIIKFGDQESRQLYFEKIRPIMDKCKLNKEYMRSKNYLKRIRLYFIKHFPKIICSIDVLLRIQ